MKEKSPFSCIRISNFCDLVEKQDRCQKLFNGVWTASSIQAWLYHTSNHNALHSSLFLLGLILWVILSLSRSLLVLFCTTSFNFFGLGRSGKSKKLKLLKNLVKMKFYKLVLKHFLKVLDHLRLFDILEKLGLLVKKQSWNRTSKRKTISEHKI